MSSKIEISEQLPPLTTTTTTTTSSSSSTSTTLRNVNSLGSLKPMLMSASTSNARLSAAGGGAAAPGAIDSLVNNVALLNNSESENDPGVGEREKKIVNEFVYLLDKSKQLFNGLK